MDRMAQRMVSIKKDMMHDDDDDVDRIYWALARGPGQMLLHGSEIPHTFHMPCDQLQRSISVRALPCLGRSMSIEVKRPGQRRAGDIPQFNRGQVMDQSISRLVS
jgi:hypothetical protein